jgi:hypothetical protein
MSKVEEPPNFGDIGQILPLGIEDEEDRLDLDELQREITELREKRLSTNQPLSRKAPFEEDVTVELEIKKGLSEGITEPVD